MIVSIGVIVLECVPLIGVLLVPPPPSIHGPRSGSSNGANGNGKQTPVAVATLSNTRASVSS